MNDGGWDEMTASLQSAFDEFVKGDATPFAALWSEAPDVVIMGGFGGYERGAEAVQERLHWAAAQYGNGTLRMDEVAAFRGADLACTVSIEHSTGVAGDPARSVDLRVTQVFRLEPDGWRLVHRHADALRPTAAP